MGLEELRAVGLALAPLAGVAGFYGLGYYVIGKLIDRDESRPTVTEYFATWLDEVDPDFRRN